MDCPFFLINSHFSLQLKILPQIQRVKNLQGQINNFIIQSKNKLPIIITDNRNTNIQKKSLKYLKEMDKGNGFVKTIRESFTVA